MSVELPIDFRFLYLPTDSVLSYAEFCAFLEANADAMQLSLQLAKDKLHDAALDEVMLEVQQIKTERASRRSISGSTPR